MSTARNKVKRLFFFFLHAPIPCVSTCRCTDFARVNSVVELHSLKFLNSGKCKSRGECVEFQCFHHQGCSQVLLFPPPPLYSDVTLHLHSSDKKKFFFQALLLSQVAVNSLPSLAVVMNKMDGCFWACPNAIDAPLFRHSFLPIPNAFLTSTALQQLKDTDL